MNPFCSHLYNMFVLSDPRGYHCVVHGRGVHWSSWSARAPAEIHRTFDHHPHHYPYRPVWFPGCRREGWETLGHCYAVSIDFHTKKVSCANNIFFKEHKINFSFVTLYVQNVLVITIQTDLCCACKCLSGDGGENWKYTELADGGLDILLLLTCLRNLSALDTTETDFKAPDTIFLCQ